ncbi:MAG: 3-deoxy-D-manno-octulosonic acid transferase [Bacteroidales bacterium]|jgi:3-deoxy-D-manno-octulosonic-acid transferase|nr:3-deoxy-D-manno-octulosonic acid transferase [Bacteroidales bacterium]
MRIIYNLFIFLYPILVRCLSLKNKKAKQWIEGRKTVFKQLSEQITPHENIIWFHCASLGEFEQGRPLIEYIKEQQPNCKILLTFFSPSGYEVRKQYPLADYIFYLPNDTPSHAKKFIHLVQPSYIFFIKYEFWNNYIRQAYKNHIPFYSVSCIFSEKQFYFKWYGVWFRKQLHYISHFFTQDTHSVEVLNRYGIFQSCVSGDTRFDRVIDLVVKTKQLDVFSKIRLTDKIIVAGSTWTEDEKLLSQLLKKHDFKLIIAPHEIHQKRIEEVKRCFSSYRLVCYSQLFSESDMEDKQVVIIDVIGILSSLYRYGDIAYIGGGFGKGIHNILEAATYGKPVIFGPKHKKFKEANDLIQLAAAFSVTNYTDLNRIIRKLYANPQTIKQAGHTAKQYVQNNIGACKKIYTFVFKS